MVIKVSTVMYIVATLGFLAWFLWSISITIPGNYFYSGKKSGEMGLTSVMIIILWVTFTLVFGGIVWW